MVRKDKKNRICECCGKTFATPQKLRQHYSSTKNQCSLPSENNNNQRRVNTPKVTRPIRLKSSRLRSPSPVPAPADDEAYENVQKEITDPEPTLSPNNQKDPEAGPGPTTQANRKKQRKIVIPITAVDIHFEECPVDRDLERPHQNRSLMNKWVGEIPRSDENPAYAFNIPIFGHKYKENPYIPQLISASRQKIKEVYQTELHRKEQIKTAIAVKCSYSCSRREIDGSTYTDYMYLYHRSGMRTILSEGDIDEHITRSVGELDAQVEEALLRGSGYTLIGILTIYIETIKVL
ncbi:hypothetical protein GLOIN_2v1481003 [Rhizophagus clarus]|uniref:Uncharacterized protein n=1 Tax=Rhizophagus clarus TaxID=94130 RepID=A0A8H3MH82_9GLOM|nr:hypothetical protein GLOIN_2v1481003 [Rhizophagus clarus]